MPHEKLLRNRPKILLSGLAATALAVAGLSLMSTPTEAAPAPAASPAKKGYAGAPVNPAPYTVTQPDGTTLRVHNFGDHLANGVATVKGDYTLVKGSDGYYRYAAGLTAAGKLKASGVVAGQGAAPAEAKGLSPAPSAQASSAQTPMAGTGDDTELVILAAFTDQPSMGSTELEWHDHYFGATHSVDDFYEESSLNQFGLKPATETCGGTNNDGVTGWITLPYAHPDTGITNDPDDYVADAIEAVDGCVNYAAYDTAPADGILETNELHITVIAAGDETAYAGPGNTCDGPSVWGHEWNLVDGGVDVPEVDGVEVGSNGYTTFGEWHCADDEPVGSGHKATMGIMAHEFGHDINWPDLYDIDYSGDGIGKWSLMSGGSWGTSTGAGALAGDSPAHPDAWALYYQGWVTPIDKSTAGGQDISVPTGQSVLLSPNTGGSDWLFGEHTGNGQYFLVENRQKTGYDVSIPGCGLVVYKIDETVSPGNDANSDYADPLVKVVQADGLDQLATEGTRGDAGDPYPGSTNNQSLTDSTNPNAHFDTGAPSGLNLHVDSTTCSPTMQLDVNAPGQASPPITPPANDNFANATVVGGTSGTIYQSSKKATEEAGEPTPAGAGKASVWYRWTAPATGTATFTLAGSGYDTVMGLYTGTAVNALTPLATNDDENGAAGIYTSKITRAVTAGTTYQIAADGYDGAFGRVQFAWSFASAGTTTSTVTATHTPDPSVLGTASTVDVTVSGSGVPPTGTAVVKEGETVLGSAIVTAGKASVPLPATTALGTHNLVVQYGGDGVYKTASGTVTAHVTAPPAPAKLATTTVAKAPNKVTFKKDFKVSATVTATGGAPTGTVQVFEGSKLIGTGTLSNGTVTIKITKNLKSGKHTLTVKYLGSTTTLASETTVKVKVKKKKRHH